MIMIIIVAGWPGPHDASYQPSRVQVLPCHHPIQAETWPRLVGRVLQPVFSGADPTLGHLRFDRGNDRLPDDLLETVACCMWSANAAATATKLNPACAKLSPMLTGLAARIVTFLGLSREEMTAPAFADVVEGLDQRFASGCSSHPWLGQFSHPRSGRLQRYSGSHRDAVAAAYMTESDVWSTCELDGEVGFVECVRQDGRGAYFAFRYSRNLSKKHFGRSVEMCLSTNSDADLSLPYTYFAACLTIWVFVDWIKSSCGSVLNFRSISSLLTATKSRSFAIGRVT
jgi:hypothetical protein